MRGNDIERLARLVAALPPPPEGWVAAAQELPAHRRGLDALITRAEHDAELRAHLVAGKPRLHADPIGAFGPVGGLIAGYATLVEFLFAPPAIAAATAFPTPAS